MLAHLDTIQKNTEPRTTVATK